MNHLMPEASRRWQEVALRLGLLACRSGLLDDDWDSRAFWGLTRPPASREQALSRELERVWAPISTGSPRGFLALRALYFGYECLLYATVARMHAEVLACRGELAGPQGREFHLREALVFLGCFSVGTQNASMVCRFLAAKSRETECAIASLWNLVMEWQPFMLGREPGRQGDFFGGLYQQLLPPTLRHALGEFYTPSWLVEAVLAILPPSDGWNALDPCCGSGAFVVGIVDQLLDETKRLEPEERLHAVLARFEAADVNPFALMTTRANLLLALGPLMWQNKIVPREVSLPVVEQDALLTKPGLYRRFERVVGNPPWVAWRDLSPQYREHLREHGLGSSQRFGDTYVGGTDINVCISLSMSVLEARVSDEGVLAFLMPRQLLQSRAAKDFRRWRLGDGSEVCLRHVDDWTALRPFDAACAPATYLIQRGASPRKSCEVRVWRSRDPGIPLSRNLHWEEARRQLVVDTRMAFAAAGEGAPYVVDSPAAWRDYSPFLGLTAYQGRRAVETSPHAFFWLKVLDVCDENGTKVLVENAQSRRAKIALPSWRGILETDCLFPFLRGQDIQPFQIKERTEVVLLPHSPDSGTHAIHWEHLPEHTRSYLAAYEDSLRARSSYREYLKSQPFYSLWRVGPYTFQPYKVVWPEMGELRAAVVSIAPVPWGGHKMLVPEGKINFIGFDCAEAAHFVCACLNAPILRKAYAMSTSQTGRPATLPLAIPLYDARSWTHRALASLSVRLHQGPARADRIAQTLDWLVRRCMQPDAAQGFAMNNATSSVMPASTIRTL
ncbi:MAG: N-6 DNA methylase [Candidatus Sericytochromatia bacterium]|nr:N-6 DNA methylase [Candidatus Sericytochromatia bacterium]